MELSQLAAMIGNNLPENASNLFQEEANRRVALATCIWEEAAKQRAIYLRRLERTKEQFASRSIWYGPLKVGSRLMPRVSRWDTEEESVPYSRYLEQMIGMAREDDRVRWWRAFLTQKIRRDRHNDRWRGQSDEEAHADPEWCEPDEFPIEDDLVPSVMADLRETGFDKGFSAGYYLEHFRTWRLGMKSPAERLNNPVPVMDAAKKGLEAENTSNS